MFSSRHDTTSNTNYNYSFGLLNNIDAVDTRGIPIGSWAIELGEVIYVYPDDYTCMVETISGETIPKVLCLSPWFSFSTGAGIYVYPQINSKVLVGRTSKNQYYILGFVQSPDYSLDNIYSNNRVSDLTEGDIHLSTAYGSFIQLCNQGQIIKIECDPVCKIEMQSTEHKIFLKSHRVYINTAAGLIQMDTTDEGKTTTVGYFRMRTGDVENFVKVIIGNTGVSVGDKLQLNTDGSRSSTKVIFALNICNKASITVDTDGNVITYCKSIQNRVVEDVDNLVNGMISTSVQKGVSTANNGDLKIEATGNLEIAANAGLKLSGGQDLSMSSPHVALGSTGDMEITSGGTMTRSGSLIADTASKIKHSAGGPGSIPDIANVTIGSYQLAGIMDTSISDMETYNPAMASSVPDPVSAGVSSDNSAAGTSDSTPVAPESEPETDEPPAASEDPEVKLIAVAKKEYTKQSRNGNLCREGTLTLYNTDNSVAGSYYFMNGPWGKGAVPLGTYEVSGGTQTSQQAMSVKDPVSGKTSGWVFDVSDIYDERVGANRTGIKIHPDGNLSEYGTGILVDILAKKAKAVALSMGGTKSQHMCAKGAKTALVGAGLFKSYPKGHAYQMIPVLNSMTNFVNITNQFPSKSSLANMPKGSVIVWNRKSGASKYGHMAIAIGGGMEASDHVRKIILDTSNRYGSYNVFMPIDTGVVSDSGSDGSFAIFGTYATLEDFYTKLKALIKANNGKVKLEYRKE